MTQLRTIGAPAIAYATRGSEGPRVLMVMGLGMRGAMWEPQLAELERDHRLAHFDHRGIGASDPAPRRYRMHHLADDAGKVADALGWDRFHLVGVSLGGMVAQELALRAPERLASLTLIATHAGSARGLLPTARAARLFVQSATVGDRIAALEQLLYPPSALPELRKAGLRERLAQQVAWQQSTQSALHQLYAVTRFNSRRRLARLRVPTLVLKAGQDILIRPYHSDFLARSIPGAKLHAFDDAGHGLIFQSAARVADQIRAHVAAHEPDRA